MNLKWFYFIVVYEFLENLSTFVASSYEIIWIHIENFMIDQMDLMLLVKVFDFIHVNAPMEEIELGLQIEHCFHSFSLEPNDIALVLRVRA